MWVDLEALLANVEHSIVNDRKLNFRVVVDVLASVWQEQSFDAVRSIADLPESQQKTAHFTAHNIIAKQTEQFTIRDEVIIPPNKHAVSEMLSVELNVISKEINLATGRVDVSGDLIVSPLYRGQAEDSVVELIEFELPFSGSLDVQAAKENAMADVTLSIADHLIEVAPDAEGANRVLSVEVVISTDIKITENREFEVLEDAYCIEQNLEPETKSVDYVSLVCRNKNQATIKESIALTGAPEVLQVLTANGVMLIEESKVVEDKVVVEGILQADILYIANSDSSPMHSYRAHVPFKQVIETKGAKVGMDVKIRHGIDSISFNMQGGNEVELRFSLNFDTTVQETKAMQLIYDIEFSPLDTALIDGLPSMVIIAASTGDSLWSVAKRYNADLEELASINELEPTASLSHGQKLLIVKKVVEA